MPCIFSKYGFAIFKCLNQRILSAGSTAPMQQGHQTSPMGAVPAEFMLSRTCATMSLSRPSHITGLLRVMENEPRQSCFQRSRNTTKGLRTPFKLCYHEPTFALHCIFFSTLRFPRPRSPSVFQLIQVAVRHKSNFPSGSKEWSKLSPAAMEASDAVDSCLTRPSQCIV